jgi:hypothetical protein
MHFTDFTGNIAAGALINQIFQIIKKNSLADLPEGDTSVL